MNNNTAGSAVIVLVVVLGLFAGYATTMMRSTVFLHDLVIAKQKRQQ